LSAGGVRVSSISLTFTDPSSEGLSASSENSEDDEEEKTIEEDVYEEELVCVDSRESKSVTIAESLSQTSIFHDVTLS